LARRPDLLESAELDDEAKEILARLNAEGRRQKAEK